MIWIIVGFSIVWLIDFKPLVQSKNKAAITTFIIIFFGTLTLAILHVYQIQVPSIMLFLSDIIKFLGLNYPS